jgi:hypothetical protein
MDLNDRLEKLEKDAQTRVVSRLRDEFRHLMRNT